MRVYKVTADGTEYVMTNGTSALTFAEFCKNYMVVKDNYSWSGKVTIELVDEDGTPEPIEDDDEGGDDLSELE